MSTPTPAGDWPVDLTQLERQIVAAVRPFTMTSLERIVSLCRAVEHVSRWKIPGDVVECGVWRGGSMLAAAAMLAQVNDTARTLWLYDTFEGMPPPADIDRDHAGVPAAEWLRSTDQSSVFWARASLEEVQATMQRVRYPADRIRFIKGKVEDTIPAQGPDEIALLRIDTDWFESTYHELVHLYPRLTPGGILIIDDYGHWSGAKAAVDRYIQENSIPLFLARIDFTSRIAVKP